MKKYKTGGFREEIEEIEVERESEQSVWIKGRRVAKEGSMGRYFDTWDEAKAFLVSAAERGVGSYRRLLESAEKRLAKMQALQKP